MLRLASLLLLLAASAYAFGNVAPRLDGQPPEGYTSLLFSDGSLAYARNLRAIECEKVVSDRAARLTLDAVVAAKTYEQVYFRGCRLEAGVGALLYVDRSGVPEMLADDKGKLTAAFQCSGPSAAAVPEPPAVGAHHHH